jgi:hypothetical protein
LNTAWDRGHGSIRDAKLRLKATTKSTERREILNP